MLRETYRPPRPHKAREQALYESLARGELDALADRSNPLPADMNIEETVRSLSKVLLGYYDALWGLDGGIPRQRRRW